MPNMLYNISRIKDIINATGEIVQDYHIDKLLTDSRQINNGLTGLFFALNGRRDGHVYITEAYAAGVRNFVIHQPINVTFSDANFLLVTNVLTALQTLASQHRNQFDLEVIGITGSNGKTIVKEWLYQLMATDKNIVRNPKSYNSQIGVPLSVWEITEKNTLGIFEAGISTIRWRAIWALRIRVNKSAIGSVTIF